MSFPVQHWGLLLKSFKYTSWGIVLLSFLINPWFLAKILHKTTFFSGATVRYILVLEIILFFLGIILFLFSKYYFNRCSDIAKERIFLILFSILFSLFLLLFLEGFIRLFFPQKTLTQISSVNPPIYEIGENIPWQLKPNSTFNMTNGEFNVEYHINSLGMRDKEYNISKENETIRILLVGDSFTVGFSVDYNETWATLLEEELNKNSTKKIEILNAGVSGYSLDSEYIYLKNNVVNIKPDLILVGFYIGNDITDFTFNTWITDEKGLPIQVISNLYSISNNTIVLNPLGPITPRWQRYIFLILERFSHMYILLNNALYGTMNRDLEPLYNYLESPENSVQQEYQENLNKTYFLLEAMSTLAKDNNSSLKIILIPPRMQINDKEWIIIERQFSKNIPDRNLPQKRLIFWCQNHNMSCIDLYPPLYNYSHTDDVLYNYLADTHINKLGNKIIAEILSQQTLIEPD